jgi:hypothetical protein
VYSGSSIAAASGAIWQNDPYDGSTCCIGPYGTPINAPVVQEIPDHLFGTGPAHLGQPWTVGWDVPFYFAILFVAFDVAPAPQLGNPNLYMPPPHYLGLVLPPQGQIDTVVPADAALIGVEYAVQVYSLVGWSRPLAGVIAP